LAAGALRVRAVAGREIEQADKTSAAVAAWLDRLVTRVEREVNRGAKIWLALRAKLVERAERAARPRVSRAPRTGSKAWAANDRRRAFADGQLDDGHDRWVVERILHGEVRTGGAAWLLVRWAGVHDDSWVAYKDLKEAYKPTARKWLLTTIGHRIRTPGSGEPPAGPDRYRRLVRTCDGGRFATLASTRLARRQREETKGAYSDDGGGTAGERKRRRAERYAETEWVEIPRETGGRGRDSRKRGRVVLDELDELGVRGEAWRERAATRGRGVRRRTR
jgi:hypothetical protein